jgi:transcription antitermination factor NusG
MAWSVHPFLKIGQRVRIKSGAMSGVEGILVGRNGERSLIVSVEVIQRSLAVRIEGYEIEAV